MTRRFSERIGIVEATNNIQTEGMSEDLRNSLWNFIHSQFQTRYDYWIPVAKYIARFFRKVPVDELPYRDWDCRDWVKEYFYGLEWYEVYDLIEFLVVNCRRILDPPPIAGNRLEETYNAIFERELSGFRFISGTLAPISSPVETQEISGAMESAARTGLSGAHAHLQAALKLLGQKPDPDYRNSIKESISAIESVVKKISGAKSQGVSGALRELEKQLQIHGALRKALENLYGYTSDSDGIRHAILDEPTVGFDEAKYMLVSCSAFVNYLISKADKVKILNGAS